MLLVNLWFANFDKYTKTSRNSKTGYLTLRHPTAHLHNSLYEKQKNVPTKQHILDLFEEDLRPEPNGILTKAHSHENAQ